MACARPTRIRSTKTSLRLSRASSRGPEPESQPQWRQDHDRQHSYDPPPRQLAHADKPWSASDPRYLGGPQRAARRFLRALSQDQELPLARLRAALLLDEQADQIYATTDPIAERVRKLGGTTLRSIGHIARLQRVLDNDAEYVTPLDMLAELREDNAQLADRIRQTHTVCDEPRDVATTMRLELV